MFDALDKDRQATDKGKGNDSKVESRSLFGSIAADGATPLRFSSNAGHVSRSHQHPEPTQIHKPKPPDYRHPDDEVDPQGRLILYRGPDGTA